MGFLGANRGRGGLNTTNIPQSKKSSCVLPSWVIWLALPGVIGAFADIPWMAFTGAIIGAACTLDLALSRITFINCITVGVWLVVLILWMYRMLV